MTITVTNKYKMGATQEGDFYIGRGSPLGNPYKIAPGGYSRKQVLDLYKKWFQQQWDQNNPDVKFAISQIHHRYMRKLPSRLICFCAPLPCHGDIIKKFICERL